MAAAYLVVLIALAFFTLAKSRRIVGALVGGIVAAGVGLGAIAVGENMGWWRTPIWTVSLFVLGYVGLAVSLAPFLLVSWRVARRFGLRGLVIGVGGAAIVGPIRDYAFASVFPDWIVFSPGLPPILAVSATYVSWVVVGHASMRLVAGPARRDALRSRSHPTVND